MVDTTRSRRDRASDIYARLGVRTIINARGATTAVGGTLMSPEVTAAMAGAAKAFVVLDELNAKVGEKIAEVTGAEAGYVTSGSAAGMALAAAACIAGTDPVHIRRLPESDGLANEIVIHHCHRINYDQMYRVGGGRLVEIGLASGTERWSLERAIGDRTAAIAYHDSPAVGRGALDFDDVISIAHSHHIPVIVDAASTLPPVDHLRRWIRRGADLVIYSGGKGIRGPQDTGLLAGRADLIAAASANGNPNAGIGRAMKASKEAMVGLWVALDQFLTHDHSADLLAHRRQAMTIVDTLAGRTDLLCEVEDDCDRWPFPIVRIYPWMCGGKDRTRWSAHAVRVALANGDPSIHLNVEGDGLMINTHCLSDDDADEITRRLRQILDHPDLHR
ncbi:MAG: aminotransferase class V-fold PLP-dependent enzyme [Thermomicrobiales bacterium]